MLPNQTWQTVRKAAQAISNADALLIGCGSSMVRVPPWPGAISRGLQESAMNYPWWFKLPRVTEDNPDSKIQPSINFAWAYWHHMHRCFTASPPHPCYEWMRSWTAEKQYKGFVITENTDGLWQTTGFDTELVYEANGNLGYAQCMSKTKDACKEFVWKNKVLKDLTIDRSAFVALEPLPKCKHCGGEARPNVLFADDPDFTQTRETSQSERLVKWIGRVKSGVFPKVVALEIGVGENSVVRKFTTKVSTQLGGTLIRIHEKGQSFSSTQEPNENLIEMEHEDILEVLELVHGALLLRSAKKDEKVVEKNKA
eukprot:gb/GEZN01013307.1/.p1 GENE.gb/GEZN01013307.1/~~gb/GEZN01013307.1/.p1  ORF type:complete len:312 (-),score=36.95 gb/GEZN01013307.1/:68-1003(-)